MNKTKKINFSNLKYYSFNLRHLILSALVAFISFVFFNSPRAVASSNLAAKIVKSDIRDTNKKVEKYKNGKQEAVRSAGDGSYEAAKATASGLKTVGNTLMSACALNPLAANVLVPLAAWAYKAGGDVLDDAKKQKKDNESVTGYASEDQANTPDIDPVTGEALTLADFIAGQTAAEEKGKFTLNDDQTFTIPEGTFPISALASNDAANAAGLPDKYSNNADAAQKILKAASAKAAAAVAKATTGNSGVGGGLAIGGLAADGSVGIDGSSGGRSVAGSLGGGGGGSAAAGGTSVEGSDSYAGSESKKRGPLIAAEKSMRLAGAKTNLNGTSVGVAQDNIFHMIQRRYNNMHKAGKFLAN